MGIVEYIQDDLRNRLVEGRTLPAPLTLRGLAGHYQVSVTPVRAAVEALIGQRHLRRADDGRLQPIQNLSQTVRLKKKPEQPVALRALPNAAFVDHRQTSDDERLRASRP